MVTYNNVYPWKFHIIKALPCDHPSQRIRARLICGILYFKVNIRNILGTKRSTKQCGVTLPRELPMRIPIGEIYHELNWYYMHYLMLTLQKSMQGFTAF
jgi:hypothetical protein